MCNYAKDVHLHRTETWGLLYGGTNNALLDSGQEMLAASYKVNVSL